MRSQRLVFLSILAFWTLGLVPGSSFAQGSTNYTVGIQAGLGGATDSEPDTEFDNFGFQAFFAMKTQVRTEFVVRLGQLGLEAEGNAFEADLSYLTLSGEYSFSDAGYDSGLFIGLGIYDLSADFGIADDSAFGLTLGTTGDFRLTDRLSLAIELSGHFADLDNTQFFIMGHAGIAYHF